MDQEPPSQVLAYEVPTEPLHWFIPLAGALLGLDVMVDAAVQWRSALRSGPLTYLSMLIMYDPYSLYGWVRAFELLFRPVAALLLLVGAGIWFTKGRALRSNLWGLSETSLMRGSAVAVLLLGLAPLITVYGVAEVIANNARTGQIVWSSDLLHVIPRIDCSVVAAPLLIFLLLLQRRRLLKRERLANSEPSARPRLTGA